MISTTIVDRLDMKNWIKVAELDTSWEAPGAPAARLSAGFYEEKFLFQQMNESRPRSHPVLPRLKV